jgi:hypothetical protein
LIFRVQTSYFSTGSIDISSRFPNYSDQGKSCAKDRKLAS